MTSEIQKKIADWTYVQSIGLDFLKMLTDEQLAFTVGKNMGTLGEQFRHMIRIRLQYAEAIATKKVARSVVTIDPAVATSKEKLLALWQQANDVLLNNLKQADPEVLEKTPIDWTFWGGESLNIHDHLNMLMDHETLHHGEIVVYLRTMGVEFPKSWQAYEL